MTKDEIMKVYVDASEEFLKGVSAGTMKFERFNYTNAYIASNAIYVDGYTVRLFKSYQTIVGLAIFEKELFIEIDKFSTTTSKQMTQIYNRYFKGYSRIKNASKLA